MSRLSDELHLVASARSAGLVKTPTGIRGFDAVTHGGLPKGRATLVTGAAGTGKTLFGVEFLVRGAQEFGEPGVLMSFEESAEEIAQNVASLGFDVAALERSGHLMVDAVRLARGDAVASGEFDLEGLFIRLAGAIDAVAAQRVVLDSIETLFTGLGDEGIVRTELTRLFRWLKDRGLTAVVTGERGRGGQLTRFGIEEYVSDCVVCLDHRVEDEFTTRRIRVVKYRGSEHGTNEFPFLITEAGIHVLPITSVGLAYDVSDERVSTGVLHLDEVLGGGIFRGSTTMIIGGAGTGKTILASHLVDAACARGEGALFVSFEESPKQLIRNMRSVGIDLRRWVDQGLLTVWAERSTTSGLEGHLGKLQRILEEQSPQLVVLDAVGSLFHVGGLRAVASVLAREIDLMKERGITVVLTALTPGSMDESAESGVSTLIDTLLLLRNAESSGEYSRLLFVIKSRGTTHSHQVREFLITPRGAELVEVYVGRRGVVTGSARVAAMAQERARDARHELELQQRRLALERRSLEVESEIARLRAQLDTERRELELLVAGTSTGSVAQAVPLDLPSVDESGEGIHDG